MPGLRWMVGGVEVHQLVEVEAGTIIQSIIDGATPAAICEIDWLIPHFADSEGNLKAAVQGFLIRSSGRNILIDTCVGNDKERAEVPEWSQLDTAFLTGLNNLGLSAEDVDIVACTHLHMDHVGWNTRREDGSWVPTFPNASYLFAGDEYEYWRHVPEKEIADDHAAFRDSVSPIVEAGLAHLVDINHEIDEHVRFMPTPGHTPGHVSVVIESGDARAVISGDALHHPCQMARPEWSTESDTDPDRARETRIKLLADLAETETLLLGSHFADPVAGTVVRAGTGYELRLS
jgi:glyoxylase-like metal-dependent hydrolase (beta-lactamase superfamily II)